MDFQDFQAGTNSTNVYSDAIFDMLKPLYVLVNNSNDDDARAALSELELILNIAYPLLGYVGEVAELANKFKKVIRNDRSIDEFINLSFDEQGDCLYYAAQLAEQTGFELHDVAKSNNKKLADRMERGVIRGDGDNR
jgi:NTP pyrophosphatase (non-canonical NTP hydrolase)